MGLVKLCVKRITPFWFQVPPRVPDMENNVWGGPPETSIFLRPELSTNPTNRLSGDQNGFAQYSVPGIIRASNESKERIQSEVFPALPAIIAIREPSGEIAKALRFIFSGISMENFNGFSSALFCSQRRRNIRLVRKSKAETACHKWSLRSRFCGRPSTAAVPSAIHFSSSITSWAVCQRSSGSLARQFFTRRSNAGGESGCIEDIGCGSEDKIAAIKLAWLFPVKAFLPVAISYSTSPIANRSVRASASRPSNCSGDIY